MNGRRVSCCCVVVVFCFVSFVVVFVFVALFIVVVVVLWVVCLFLFCFFVIIIINLEFYSSSVHVPTFTGNRFRMMYRYNVAVMALVVLWSSVRPLHPFLSH